MLGVVCLHVKENGCSFISRGLEVLDNEGDDFRWQGR